MWPDCLLHYHVVFQYVNSKQKSVSISQRKLGILVPPGEIFKASTEICISLGRKKDTKIEP